MREKILIASKNPDKVKEIKEIFNRDLFSLNDMKAVAVIEETGETFSENALIKAKYYYHNFRIPVIADDSGLVVPALNGQPGIYSARFAGEGANYQDNNTKLLEIMKNLSGVDRNAFFVCYAVYYNKNIIIETEGRVNGIIIERPKGSSGFGYDPLFFIPEIGKTFAELKSEEKNKISHRYIAFRELKNKLENRNL